MTGFNLQSLVDRALDATTAADPHMAARNALMRIAPERREEALLVALAVFTELRVYERQGEGQMVATLAHAGQVRSGVQ